MWPFWRLCYKGRGILKSHSKILTNSITANGRHHLPQIISQTGIVIFSKPVFFFFEFHFFDDGTLLFFRLQDQTALPLISPLLPLLRLPNLSAVLFYIPPFPTFPPDFVFFPSIQLTCSLNIYYMLGTVLEAGCIMVNIVVIQGAVRLYGIFMWITERITLLKILLTCHLPENPCEYTSLVSTLIQDTTICIYSSQGMPFGPCGTHILPERTINKQANKYLNINNVCTVK